ncbi:hypothetical protein [Verrucomicrobium sp. 3C]|uniref:hypothetical protein n=1 Tax=Verrucomicrobium sp. 3C TaxID=1134055 RepID=UPI00037A0017|nr:hypothetical protein [Verrucomicrobium sp. 3C]
MKSFPPRRQKFGGSREDPARDVWRLLNPIGELANPANRSTTEASPVATTSYSRLAAQEAAAPVCPRMEHASGLRSLRVLTFPPGQGKALGVAFKHEVVNAIFHHPLAAHLDADEQRPAWVKEPPQRGSAAARREMVHVG